MKKYFLLFFIVLPFVLQAQERPDIQKKIYVSPEGRIYVNRNLPVYLWLSTSPGESSKKYRLKSEVTTQYSNPMYFDSEGYNTFRSPWAVDTTTKKTVYPKRDVVFEVYADDQSPKTTIDFGNSVPYNFEGKKYIKGDTKITLSARDNLSGTEAIYYSIDGAAFAPCAQPIALTREKEYTLKYYSVDNVGNEEEMHEVTLVYDQSAPVTTLKIEKDKYNDVVSARSKLELTAEDKGIGVSKIVYNIDNNKENTYQVPISAAYLSQGEHTINYYAIDKSGNKENGQSYTFYVDKTPPTIIEDIIAKTFFANGKEFASGKAQLKLTAFDNKAGVKEIRYRINGGDYQVYDKPVFLSNSSGNLVIECYAVDNVNNQSQSEAANQKTSIPYIDLSGPTLKFSFTGPEFTTRDTIFINSKTKISLKAIDKEAGINRIEYRVDGKENLTFDAPFSIPDEGVHTISYVGYDNVENTSSDEFYIKVDNTGPEIQDNFSILPIGKDNAEDVYPKYVIMFLSGTDTETGLQNLKYTFGDAPPKLYTVPVTDFAVGPKNIKVIATDKLGNISEKTITFTIKD